jgi:hypothetical protein
MRAKAHGLMGKVYELNLNSPRISFLLGRPENDTLTNGPVMVTAKHEAGVREVLNGIRVELGLGPFSAEHPVHTTLCKLGGLNSDHAALRQQLAGWPWPLGDPFPKPLSSLAEALGGQGEAPQLPEGLQLPPGCTMAVINAALRVASKVATKGVGEQQKAKGFLIIIGEREQLMGKGLGQPPEPRFNMFCDNSVTIDDVEKQGAAQRYVYPAFTTDGAMIIDGTTGEILASNYTVTANLADGSTAGGKKHQAASAISQMGPCFVIKCSEDSCSVDGQAHGDFGVFNGTKEADKVRVKTSSGEEVLITEFQCARRSPASFTRKDLTWTFARSGRFQRTSRMRARTVQRLSP